MFDYTKILELLKFNADDPLFFNSSLFLFLFVGFLLFYSLISQKKIFRVASLLLFSFYFYYRSGGIYVLLLLLCSLLSYTTGILIFRSPAEWKKKLFMILGILANLSVLVYFKYTNFFIEVYGSFSGKSLQPLDIILPLGISFFTFKALSYIIDVYLEKIDAEYNILDFTLYISFFANLLAGPIDRAGQFIKQIKQDFVLTESYIGRATFLIMSGLIKKDVIADYIGLNFVDRVFEDPLRFTGVENLMAVYAYALRIYCDFSGYSDLAIGIALLLGFRLMDNFNSPYKAQSVAEFWRRWHISLSSWLQDYLFKPMQMSMRRMRIFGNAFAVLITFLVCGLWHGASWTFIVWGGVHGLLMAVSMFTKPVRDYFYDKTGLGKLRIVGVMRTVITFHLIAFAWVIFSASSFEKAIDVYSQIFVFFHSEVFMQFVTAMPQIVILIALGYLMHFAPARLEQKCIELVTASPIIVKALILAIVIWTAAQVRSADLQPFIYFQF